MVEIIRCQVLEGIFRFWWIMWWEGGIGLCHFVTWLASFSMSYNVPHDTMPEHRISGPGLHTVHPLVCSMEEVQDRQAEGPVSKHDHTVYNLQCRLVSVVRFHMGRKHPCILRKSRHDVLYEVLHLAVFCSGSLDLITRYHIVDGN